ncbi:MAG: hypothetical protein GX300_07585 [Tissierellia bacterium]|nr:hypothetical protein [Tissierellia bacterium]
METRLERNLRIRKEKRIKRAKRFCIFLLLIFLYFGLETVNQNIVELDCLDNPNIFRFDLKTRQVDIFGNSYIIDLDIIKKILKTSFSGLLVLHC